MTSAPVPVGRRVRSVLVGWRGEGRLTLGLSVAVLAAVFAFFSFAATTTPDTWVPVVVVIVLVAASVPLCLFLGRGDQRLKRLLVLALLVKLFAVGPRYLVNEVYYSGQADAGRYSEAGGAFLEGVSRGEWTIEGSSLDGFPAETRFVGYVTGIVYLGFGTSYLGGYFVFSWIAWLGLLCFVQAYRCAYPNAPPYRAAGLILFLPSIVFWPSSPGKEALMISALGAATYGVTTILYGRRVLTGVPLGLFGAFVLFSVRPHVLLVVMAGLAGALIVRQPAEAGSPKRPLAPLLVRLGLLVAIVPVLVLGLSAVDDLVGDGEGGLSVSSAFDDTEASTEIGDSAFDAQGVRSLADVPGALVSVTLRPFPFEARSVVSAISSLEGVLLALAALMSARWLWLAGPAVRRSPLAAYCAAYYLAFVIAFSNISNAGILSRQRVQLFPILFLLACCGRALYDERESAASAAGSMDEPPPSDPPLGDPESELAWSPT